jgi:hypothetical protein
MSPQALASLRAARPQIVIDSQSCFCKRPGRLGV